MSFVERYAVLCGLVAPILSLGSTGLATVVAPASEFTWRAFALSDLGRPTARTFLLFNGGLILGGFVGIAFSWPLWRGARNRFERAGTVSFVLTLLGLALVGVFHLPKDPHQLVALLFFLGGPITHWLYGTGQALAGDVRFGLVSVWFGVVHVLGWTGWLIYVAVGGSAEQWFAVPEMVASLAFGCWAFALARSLLDGPIVPERSTGT